MEHSVSHDDKQVRKMCQHALWLVHGIPREKGTVKLVCDNYKEYLFLNRK